MLHPQRRLLAIFGLFLALLVACGGEAPQATSPSNDEARVDVSSEDALTESAARLLRRQLPSYRFTVVEPLTINGSGPSTPQIALDRIWAGCQQTPASCEASLRDFVKKVAQTLSQREAPITREQIVAAIRPKSYFDALDPSMRASLLSEPFVGDVMIVYMADLEGAARGLTPADLARLGVAKQELPELARRNLRARLGELPASLASAQSGTFVVVQTGSYYESSRLLSSDDWRRLAASGAVVATAPAHDVILVGVGLSREATAKMRAIAGEIFAKADRPVSAQLLFWSGSGWSTAAP